MSVMCWWKAMKSSRETHQNQQTNPRIYARGDDRCCLTNHGKGQTSQYTEESKAKQDSYLKPC